MIQSWRQFGGMAREAPAAQRADHFSALVRAITGQQLSTKAASTIYGRMVALMPDAVPSVEGFACVSDESLRAAKMSVEKTAYLRDSAKKSRIALWTSKRSPRFPTRT